MDDLAPSLYVALGHLVRALRQEVRTGALGASGVSVLAAVARGGPMRASTLARIEGVSGAGMTRTLNRLETEGLVTRVVDDADRRAQVVSLTPAGERLVAEGSEATTAALRRRLDGLSEPERRALASAIPALEKLAEGGS